MKKEELIEYTGKVAEVATKFALDIITKAEADEAYLELVNGMLKRHPLTFWEFIRGIRSESFQRL